MPGATTARISTSWLVLLITLLLTSSCKEPRPPAPGDVIEAGDVNLHMICIGEGTPTAIIDFGITNWSLHWTPVQRELAKTTRVCGYDRAGFGWSDDIVSPVNSGQLVEQLHLMLKNSEEKPPYLLIGHSFGGYVVRLYADHYPQNTAGVVLVEASHEDQWRLLPREVNDMTNAGVGMMRRAELAANFGLLRLFDIPVTDPLPTKQQRDELLRAMKTARYYDSVVQYFEAAPAIAKDVSRLDALGATPLLVLTAGRSAYAYCGENFGIDVPCEETQSIWEKLQNDLATLSSDSEQHISPKARHYIQIDDPELLVRSISDFVQKIKNSKERPEPH